MVVRPAALRPQELALGRIDFEIVDAGNAPLHEAVGREFPAFVAVGPEPPALAIMRFIGKADSNSVAGKGPQFLDQPVLAFGFPFSRQEVFNGVAAGKKF